MDPRLEAQRLAHRRRRPVKNEDLWRRLDAARRATRSPGTGSRATPATPRTNAPTNSPAPAWPRSSARKGFSGAERLRANRRATVRHDARPNARRSRLRTGAPSATATGTGRPADRRTGAAPTSPRGGRAPKRLRERASAVADDRRDHARLRRRALPAKRRVGGAGDRGVEVRRAVGPGQPRIAHRPGDDDGHRARVQEVEDVARFLDRVGALRDHDPRHALGLVRRRPVRRRHAGDRAAERYDLDARRAHGRSPRRARLGKAGRSPRCMGSCRIAIWRCEAMRHDIRAGTGRKPAGTRAFSAAAPRRARC